MEDFKIELIKQTFKVKPELDNVYIVDDHIFFWDKKRAEKHSKKSILKITRNDFFAPKKEAEENRNLKKLTKK